MGRLRAANGHEAPYHITNWELDNETWEYGLDSYITLIKRVAPLIKGRWPDVKLYACAFGEKDDPRLLAEVGKDIDFISCHFYEGPNKFASAPNEFEDLFGRYAGILAASPNPNVRLAVTEWNAQSTDWRTGLFAGGYLNVMERSSEVVQMASPSLFIRRTDAPDRDNAFINHDNHSWHPAPNYVVMKLYRDHFEPLRIASETAGTLNAVATRSEDGKRVIVKIVNARSTAINGQIEIAPAVPVRHSRAWEVAASPDDRNDMEHPRRIDAASRSAAVKDGKLIHSFPAYSVTVIQLESK
jgi:alpha-N-arabinofuranosidase